MVNSYAEISSRRIKWGDAFIFFSRLKNKQGFFDLSPNKLDGTFKKEIYIHFGLALIYFSSRRDLCVENVPR